MKNEEIATRINNFFLNPRLTSTYKIVLFKAILRWCQNIPASDTLLLSLDSIAEYFIKTYAHYYQNKEIHHLTNKKKAIDFFNLLSRINYRKNNTILDGIVESLLDDGKKIILQDVIYRFRNSCSIYDFIIKKKNNLERIDFQNNIIESEFAKFRSEIQYIKFDKDIISYLRINSTVLVKALDLLLIEFLTSINDQFVINLNLLSNNL